MHMCYQQSKGLKYTFIDKERLNQLYTYIYITKYSFKNRRIRLPSLIYFQLFNECYKRFTAYVKSTKDSTHGFRSIRNIIQYTSDAISHETQHQVMGSPLSKSHFPLQYVPFNSNFDHCRLPYKTC